MGNQPVSRSHSHKRGSDGGNIGDCQCHPQHFGGIVSHLGNGRRNKSDDDQRYTEGDDLPQNVFDSYHHIHDSLIGNKADDHTQDYSDQQTHRKAFE